MGIHVPTLLEGILEATAAKAAAEARITVLRAELEAEGRRRLAGEGAAPSWTTPQLGKVRLDPPGEWTATVADRDAFGSYVAQHHPTEATAVLRIPADRLGPALEAIEFAVAGLDAPGAIDVAIEVRPAWVDGYLKGLAVDVEETQGEDGSLDRVITVADPNTGALVDGLTATRSAAKLVVSLDSTRRAAAIDAAKADASELVADAATEDGPTPDGEAIRARRIELEAMGAEVLATIARAHGLGSSGTKAALAERIARAEVDTGHVIRPASGLVPEGSTDTPEEHAAMVERVDEHLGDELDPADVALAHRVLAPGDDDNVTVGDLRRERLDGLSREVLRRYARAKGINPGGTKADLLDRLVEARITVVDVNAFAHDLTHA